MLDQYLAQLKSVEEMTRQISEQLSEQFSLASPSESLVKTSQHESGLHNVMDPYSTFAANQLLAIQLPLKQKRKAIAQYFYNNLDENSSELLNMLDEQELTHLKEMQSEYLTHLLSPRLSYNQHKEIASQAGERHDSVSLSPELLVSSYHVYRRAIYALLQELEQSHSLIQIIEHRLQNDMAWQLMGYTRQVQKRSEFMEALIEMLQKSMNRDDMLEKLLDSLREVDGIEGVSVGAFVGEGKLICEKASGLVLHGSECTLGDNTNAMSASGQPLWKAWKEERSIWVNSISQELDDDCIQQDAHNLGLRSYAVLPVKTQQEAPELLLVIYSRWPGFFLDSGKQFFFEAIAREFGTHLLRVEQDFQGHFAELTLEERQHYRQLLEEGQVEMVFQPIIDPNTETVIKIESLARLLDDGQFISPYKFLAAFGSKQLISLFELGLNKACQAYVELEKQGISVNVSINLPTEAFDNNQVLFRIYATVHQYGVPPERIALEILETGVLKADSAIQAIKTLKNKGFTISLDDVGSGESSMMRMKQLPIDEIKVDQGFVRPMLQQMEHLDYVHTLVRLANSLNLGCVVEGVENEKIIDMVKTIGGAHLQGYGIAKPMPLNELTKWIQHRHQNREILLSQSDLEKGYTPKTLCGWYARHLNRARILLEAFPNNIDLINFHIASHAENCPMTEALEEMGLADSPIAEAHEMFHETVELIEKKYFIEKQEPEQLKTQLKQVLDYMRQLVTDDTAKYSQ